MSGNAKDIRKQVRNVAQELLPELIKEELFDQIEKKLMKVVLARLDEISKRNEEILGFTIRQLNNPIVR